MNFNYDDNCLTKHRNSTEDYNPTDREMKSYGKVSPNNPRSTRKSEKNDFEIPEKVTKKKKIKVPVISKLMLDAIEKEKSLMTIG